MHYNDPPRILRHSVEVTHNGHMYRLVATYDAGWVVTEHCDGVLKEKRLTTAETGKEALVEALQELAKAGG